MSSALRKFLLWVVLPGVLLPLIIGLLFAAEQPLRLGEWVSSLPSIHATINAATALVLLLALWAIKQRRARLHKQLIYVCLGLGGLFLLSYLVYHSSAPSTKYGDANGDEILSATELSEVGHWRTVYLLLLLSHILLSVSVVFLVLVALYYARLRKFKQHRAVVRYAFPIWWYVSVSGVLVYFMIQPFYQ